MSNLQSVVTFVIAGCVLWVAGCNSIGGKEWDSVQVVLAASDGGAPTTAVDDSRGIVYFSWFGMDENGEAAVFAAHFTPADSIASDPVRVNPVGVTVNAHLQAPAQVAVAADGTVYVAWSTREPLEGRRFAPSNLYIARSTDNGNTFEAPVFVNDDAGGEPAGHTFHDLALGADGTVYVSWLDSRNDETEVRVATSSDGARTFSPGVVAARGTCQCCRTSLAVHETSVYLAWRHIYGDNIRDIAFARSDDAGRTFTAPKRVRMDGWKIDGCPHSGPSLAVGSEGAIHVSWYTAAVDSEGLLHAVSTDGGANFADASRLESGVPIAQANLAGGDDVWAIWENPLADVVHTGPIGRRDRTMTFAGSSPEIAASAGVRSFVWQQGGAVKALIQRTL